jgi:hypothetical protein
MSEARALLERIVNIYDEADGFPVGARRKRLWECIAEARGVLDRADRPEARVAEGLDYRALYDGRVREWLAVTAYLGTEADSAGELIAAIDARCRADRPEARVAEGLCAFGACGAERVSWQHLPCSRSEPDPCPEPCPAMDSGCHPFLPAPRPPEPDHDRPEARVAEGLLAEMVGDYHQTGSIRDHVDPGAAGWDVNKDWRICEDSLCVATRDVLANLPAPRPQEPLCLCGEPRVAGVHDDDDLDLHAYTPRPPEPDRTASPTHPEPCADPDHTSDADRPEARVAEGLTVERCAGYDLSDRPDLAPNIVCTLPAGHTGYHLPAPRPPEPDRTALVEKAMQDDMRRHPEAYGLPTPDEAP